jgi:glycerol kinase
MKYILAFDQGTTSSRTIVFDEQMKIVSLAQREFRQIYPQPGWVEHDPFDILGTQLETMREAVAKAGINTRDIAAAAIANQRETVVVWDKRTGRPVCNAIVWQCRRSAEYCSGLKADGLEDEINSRTGLLADAYFSCTKIKWILDNVPGARSEAEAGNLLFGTIDAWLIWNLTANKNHFTDVTNASRTMLFNIRNMKWDTEMQRILGVPSSMLPDVLPCSAEFGFLRKDILGREIPICGVAGDQQAALFGQACFAPGDVKNTYGTGCFLLMNTGEKPVSSKNRLLTTVAWDAGHGPLYALEGSVFTGGAAVQWLRDGLGLIRLASETEELALSVPDTDGVYLVPAFSGLGAPWWDMYARGTIVGITRGTGREHIVRAALEAIAYQSADMLGAMEADAGIRLSTLRVDGGAAANNFLMQFQADLLGRPVIRPGCVETTAMGAAYFAGLQAGLFADLNQIANLCLAGKEFNPSPDSKRVQDSFSGWHKAVDRAKNWIEHV